MSLSEPPKGGKWKVARYWWRVAKRAFEDTGKALHTNLSKSTAGFVSSVIGCGIGYWFFGFDKAMDKLMWVPVLTAGAFVFFLIVYVVCFIRTPPTLEQERAALRDRPANEREIGSEPAHGQVNALLAVENYIGAVIDKSVSLIADQLKSGDKETAKKFMKEAVEILFPTAIGSSIGKKDQDKYIAAIASAKQRVPDDWPLLYDVAVHYVNGTVAAKMSAKLTKLFKSIREAETHSPLDAMAPVSEPATGRRLTKDERDEIIKKLEEFARDAPAPLDYGPRLAWSGQVEMFVRKTVGEVDADDFRRACDSDFIISRIDRPGSAAETCLRSIIIDLKRQI